MYIYYKELIRNINKTVKKKKFNVNVKERYAIINFIN